MLAGQPFNCYINISRPIDATNITLLVKYADAGTRTFILPSNSKQSSFFFNFKLKKLNQDCLI